MVLHRGLENLVAQGLWGTETACQVGLSGVYDLDKWRGAGISKISRGCARAVLVESALAGGQAGVMSPIEFLNYYVLTLLWGGQESPPSSLNLKAK